MYNVFLTGTQISSKVAEALSGVQFEGLYTEMLAVMPTVLGISITLIGLKKAIGFVLSTIRQA